MIEKNQPERETAEQVETQIPFGWNGDGQGPGFRELG
jgi:hypothetical protein